MSRCFALDSGSRRVETERFIEDSPAQRIVTLLQQLDDEEIATIERCADAFAKATTDDVRQHLIGQLKIIERLVQHELATGPPNQKATGAD